MLTDMPYRRAWEAALTGRIDTGGLRAALEEIRDGWLRLGLPYDPSPREAVDAPARAIAGEALRRAIAATPNGPEHLGVFVLGPEGAGKTTVLDRCGLDRISAFCREWGRTDLGEAGDDVAAALDRGVSVFLLYVHGDPVQAFWNMLVRSLDHPRRTKPIEWYVASCLEAPATLRRILHRFDGAPRFDAALLDNTMSHRSDKGVRLEVLAGGRDEVSVDTAHRVYDLLTEKVHEIRAAGFRAVADHPGVRRLYATDPSAVDDPAPFIRPGGLYVLSPDRLAEAGDAGPPAWDPPSLLDQPGADIPIPVKDPVAAEKWGDIDIGVLTGRLADGRPFRADLWFWDNFLGLTYVFSPCDIEEADDEAIRDLLARSGELRPVHETTRRLVRGLIAGSDADGDPTWSITVHLGLSDGLILPDRKTHTFGWEEREPLEEVLSDSVVNWIERSLGLGVPPERSPWFRTAPAAAADGPPSDDPTGGTDRDDDLPSIAYPGPAG